MSLERMNDTTDFRFRWALSVGWEMSHHLA